MKNNVSITIRRVEFYLNISFNQPIPKRKTYILLFFPLIQNLVELNSRHVKDKLKENKIMKNNL